MTAKNGKKVFCQNCAYERDHHCDHPRNLEDDAYAPKHAHKDAADYINQHNDCKWFKRYRHDRD